MIPRLAIAIVSLLLTISFPVFAGTEYVFSCKKCDLHGRYGMGGGFFFDEVSTYCTNKDHFVSISWNRGAWFIPRPVRKDDGIPIYKCPQCKTPTAKKWPIELDPKRCPRCRSTNIITKETGLQYD